MYCCAASEALRRITADPKHLGADTGFLAVLHTWEQNLLMHPHLHCMVPGGGLSPDRGKWVSSRKRFFLPVRVLSRLFRGLFLYYLEKAYSSGKLQFYGTFRDLNDTQEYEAFIRRCRDPEWMVYSKPLFGGPDQVLDYQGRYTHRVAISNDRLVKMHDGKVTFRWRNYKAGNELKTTTLDAHEFIRRFLLHVVPRRFVRIRHYGIVANPHSEQNIALCRQLLDVKLGHVPGSFPTENWMEHFEKLTGEFICLCPVCRQGRMVPVECLEASNENCSQPEGMDHPHDD